MAVVDNYANKYNGFIYINENGHLVIQQENKELLEEKFAVIKSFAGFIVQKKISDKFVNGQDIL